MNPEPTPTLDQPKTPGATLPQGWAEFVAKPDDNSAVDVARALREMDPGDRVRSMELIASTLAQRSAGERSSMSRLLAYWIADARAFLQATAAVTPTLPTVPPTQPRSPEPLPHLDLAQATKPGPKQPRPDTSDKTPGGRDRLLLEGLDLAATAGGTVDLIEVERHVDDVRDYTSVRHLEAALRLINATGTGTPYSEQRRTELAGTVKGTTQEHIVEQIGFRAAPSQRHNKGGLSAQNEMEASYWRSSFDRSLELFLERLRKRIQLGRGDVLVNSPRVLSKLNMVLDPDVVRVLTIRPAVVGTTGLSVLGGNHNLPKDGEGYPMSLAVILQELGAAPSAYQLYELMDLEKDAPEDDFEVDTLATIAEIITCSAFSRLQQVARGKGRMAPVCTMVEHLVLGLTDGFGAARFDRLTANALYSLNRLLDILVQNLADPSVAMRVIDLMVDEIGVVVAVAARYTRTDYQDATRAILVERAPSIAELLDERIELGIHLMSSGMDAITTALWIALSTRGHTEVSRPTEQIDYFETALLLDKLKKGETVAPRTDVLIAALNPSTPFTAPSAGKLVEDVLKGLQTRGRDDAPFALILDTTIQLPPGSSGDRGQLDIVLGGLSKAIASGELEVFLCKSFQKYASFGTGKVAAGDLTMLSCTGNLASATGRYEALLHELDLDLTGHDEMQLLVHMLKHGHRDELALARNAARNAQFVDTFCWPIDPSDESQGSSYKTDIPLLLRSTPTGDVNALFRNLALIDQRDSFSFLRTSFVGGIDIKGVPYARINTGHESAAAMVEFFYAFGHLATSTLPGAAKPEGTKVSLSPLMAEAVHVHLQALDRVLTTDTTGVQRYRNNIIASYCTAAYAFTKSRPAKIALLVAFFTKSTDGVTIETQRFLADALFALAPALNEDTTVLAAVCRAAEVLPKWQFKRLAKNLKLDKIGDSTEAQRLRDLVTQAK